jgi:hypothetical protein
MTTKQAAVQQPLLSNGSAKKHVSMATREHSSNGRYIFYVVCAEITRTS